MMQMKLNDEKETKELLYYADILKQEDGTGNTDYRKLKIEIRNASTAKMDVIEAIDEDTTQKIEKSKDIDDRVGKRIKGLIPNDD